MPNKKFLDSDGLSRVWSKIKAIIPTKTSDLTNDGASGTSTYVEGANLATVATSGSYNDLTDKPTISTGLVEMSYGETNAWSKFIAAYSAKKIVYCRASSAANPASGTQGRKAFMAYVNNANNPTEVEFQYVRSVGTKTEAQQGDQVFVYKLTSSGGGTWTVQTREMFSKIAAGANMTSSYANGVLTLNVANAAAMELIATVDVSESVQSITISQDSQGNAFALGEALLEASFAGTGNLSVKVNTASGASPSIALTSPASDYHYWYRSDGVHLKTAFGGGGTADIFSDAYFASPAKGYVGIKYYDYIFQLSNGANTNIRYWLDSETFMATYVKIYNNGAGISGYEGTSVTPKLLRKEMTNDVNCDIYWGEDKIQSNIDSRQAGRIFVTSPEYYGSYNGRWTRIAHEEPILTTGYINQIELTSTGSIASGTCELWGVRA